MSNLKSVKAVEEMRTEALKGRSKAMGVVSSRCPRKLTKLLPCKEVKETPKLDAKTFQKEVNEAINKILRKNKGEFQENFHRLRLDLKLDEQEEQEIKNFTLVDGFNFEWMEYTAETSFLVFWKSDEVRVYQVGDTVKTFASINNFTKDIGLLEKKSLVIKPNGREVIIFGMKGAAYFDLGQNPSNNWNYRVIQKFQNRPGNILWHSFFSRGVLEEGHGDFKDQHPHSLIYVVGKELKHYQIKFKTSKHRAKHNSSVHDEPEIVLKELSMRGAPPMNLEDKYSKFTFSQSNGLLWTVKLVDDVLTVESYHTKIIESTIEYSSNSWDTFTAAIEMDLFKSTKLSESGMLLVSDPTQQVYELEFSKTCSFNEIMTLSTGIDRIQSISKTSNIVTLTVNDGQLLIYSQMRTGLYDMIYTIPLHSSSTKVYLCTKLHYIFMYTQMHVSYLKFMPFTVAHRHYYDMCGQEGMLDNSGSDDSTTFHILNSRYTLVHDGTSIYVQDLHTNGSIHSDINSTFDINSSSQCKVCKVGENTWYAAVFFNKRHNDHEASDAPPEDDSKQIGNNFGKGAMKLAARTSGQGDTLDPSNIRFNQDSMRSPDMGDCLGILDEGAVNATSSPNRLTDNYAKDTLIRNKNNNEMMLELKKKSSHKDVYLLFKIQLTIDETSSPVKHKDLTMKFISCSTTEGFSIFECKKNTVAIGSIDRLSLIVNEIETYDISFKDYFSTDLIDKQELTSKAKVSLVNEDLLFIWQHSRFTHQTTDEKFFKNDYAFNIFNTSSPSELIQGNSPSNMQHSSSKKSNPNREYSKVVNEVNDNSIKLLTEIESNSTIDIDSQVQLEDDNILIESPAIVNVFDIKSQQVCTFSTLLGLQNLYTSSSSKYLLFYGTKGFILYYARDGVYTAVLTMYNTKYRIDSSDMCVFSPDERYLAVAFAYGNKTVLFNLEEEITEFSVPRIRVTSTELFTCPSLNKLSTFFAFYQDADQSIIAITEAKERGKKVVVRVYDILLKSYIAVHSFVHDMSPVYLELSHKGIKVLLKTRSNIRHKARGIYKCIFQISNTLPFSSILRHNLLTYIDKQEYTLLYNTLKSIHNIVYDIRILCIMYIINRYDILYDIYSMYDVYEVFSVCKLLDVIYYGDVLCKTNSIHSINMLFKDLIAKKDQLPRIDISTISDALKFDPELLTFNSSSKEVFTNLIFSTSGVHLRGLLRSKYGSLLPISLSDMPAISSSSLLNKDTIETMVDDLLIANPSLSVSYEVFRTRIPLELTNGSTSSMNLLRTILKMPNEEIKYKYEQIVNYKWNMVYWYSLIYTMLYLFLNGIVYTYFGYSNQSWMFYIIILLNIVFLAFEMKCIISCPKICLRDPINWLDIAVHSICGIAAIISFYELDSRWKEYINLAVIILVSARGIVFLRIFSGLRSALVLMGEVLYDLRFLPFLFAFVLVLSATIYKVSPMPYASLNNNMGFLESLQEVFLIMFMGSQAESTQFSDRSTVGGIFRSIILVISGTLVAQAVFNFIIAAVINVFRDSKENRRVYELKSQVLDTLDFDMFLHGFERFSKPVKEYFFIMVPDSPIVEAYANEGWLGSITGTVGGMFKQVGLNAIDNLSTRAKSLAPQVKDQIETVTTTLHQNAAEIDPKAKDLVNSVERLAAGAKINIGDITTASKVLSKAIPDGRAKDIVEKAGDVVNRLADVSQRLAEGEDIEVEEIFGYVENLAQVADPNNKRYSKKIKSITDIARRLFKEVEDIDLEDPKRITRIIKETIDSTSELTGKAKELKPKILEAVTTIEVVTEETLKLEKGLGFDLTRVMKHSCETFNRIKDSVDIALDKPTLSKVTDTISKMTVELSNLTDDSPEALLHLASRVSKSLTTKSTKSIEKALHVTKGLIHSLKSNKLVSVPSMISACLPAYELDPQLSTKIIEIVKSLDSAVYDPNLDSDIRKYIKLLDSFNLDDKVKHRVDNIRSILDYTYQHMMLYSDKALDYPSLFASVSKLINLYNPIDDVYVTKTTRILELVQATIENHSAKLSDRFVDPSVVTYIAADIVATINPKLSVQVQTIKKSMGVLFKQIENLDPSLDIDLNEVITGLSELICIHKPEIASRIPQVNIILSQLVSYQHKIENNFDFKPSELAKFGMDILESISPEMSQFSATTIRTLEYLQTFDPIFQLNEQVGLANIGKGIELAVEYANTFDPKYQKYLKDALKLSEVIQYNLIRPGIHKESIEQTLWKLSEVYTAYDFDEVDPAIDLTVNAAKALDSLKLLWESNNRIDNIGDLVKAACNIVTTFDPKLQVQTERLTVIVETIISDLPKINSPDVSLETAIKIAGKIVVDLDNSLSNAVTSTIAISFMIEKQAKMMVKNEKIDVAMVVSQFNQIFSNWRPDLVPAINKVQDILNISYKHIHGLTEARPHISEVFSSLRRLAQELNPSFTTTLDRAELLLEASISQLATLQNKANIDPDMFVNSVSSLLANLDPKLAPVIFRTRSLIRASYSIFTATIKNPVSLNYKPTLSKIGSLARDYFIQVDPKMIPFIAKVERVFKTLETQICDVLLHKRPFMSNSVILNLASEISIDVDPSIRGWMGTFSQAVEMFEHYAEKLSLGKSVDYRKLVSKMSKILGQLDPQMENYGEFISKIGDIMTDHMSRFDPLTHSNYYEVPRILKDLLVKLDPKLSETDLEYLEKIRITMKILAEHRSTFKVSKNSPLSIAKLFELASQVSIQADPSIQQSVDLLNKVIKLIDINSKKIDLKSCNLDNLFSSVLDIIIAIEPSLETQVLSSKQLIGCIISEELKFGKITDPSLPKLTEATKVITELVHQFHSQFKQCYVASY